MTRAIIVGRWQSHAYTPGRSYIVEFKANGTLMMSRREGTTVTPFKYAKGIKVGQPIILRYVVSGNRLTITFLRKRVTVSLFKRQGDKLIWTKVLMFARRSAHGLSGSTFTRFKG